MARKIISACARCHAEAVRIDRGLCHACQNTNPLEMGPVQKWDLNLTATGAFSPTEGQNHEQEKRQGSLF